MVVHQFNRVKVLVTDGWTDVPGPSHVTVTTYTTIAMKLSVRIIRLVFVIRSFCLVNAGPAPAPPPY